jgi:dipeptidyl aminopeptidase/acylaminoacyl peptidase
MPVWRPDGKAVLSLFEAWNYSRDVWAYLLEGGRERASDTLPPELDVRKMARPELVRFSSFDSREITGYLYVPDTAAADKPVPLLVTPHGGPTSQWQNSWHPFVQLLVQRGYAVFAPNVRGSSGFGVEFENLNDGDWGRGDLEDLVTGTKTVMARPEIRDERPAIWGVSYGGFLTLAALTRYPDFFACAIEALGMPDLESLYRETTEEGRAYLEREIGPLRGNLALYRELSPLSDVKQVRTPLLSFHGENYPLVPYTTKQRFFDALRQRSDYKLQEYIFKGEEARATYRHDLHPEAAWAYVEKILEFLEVYL